MEQEIKQQPVRIDSIEWEAEEFEKPKRNIGWYLVVGIILLTALIYTLYVKYWILSALMVMIGVVFYLSGNLKPRQIKYLVNETGVRIGDRIFNYDQLKTFWFSRAAGITKLNLISTFRFMPVISVQIRTKMEDKIRAALIQVIPESQNKGEDWIDKINRFLKI